MRFDFIGVDVGVVAEEIVGLHHPIAHRLTVGRGVVVEDDDELMLHRTLQEREVAVVLAREPRGHRVVDVVVVMQLALEGVDRWRVLLHAAEQAEEVSGLLLREVDRLGDVEEERRPRLEGVEAVVAADGEAVVLHCLKQVIHVARRRSERLRYLLHSLRAVAGHRPDDVEAAGEGGKLFIVGHGDGDYGCRGDGDNGANGVYGSDG